MSSLLPASSSLRFPPPAPVTPSHLSRLLGHKHGLQQPSPCLFVFRVRFVLRLVILAVRSMQQLQSGAIRLWVCPTLHTHQAALPSVQNIQHMTLFACSPSSCSTVTCAVVYRSHFSQPCLPPALPCDLPLPCRHAPPPRPPPRPHLQLATPAFRRSHSCQPTLLPLPPRDLPLPCHPAHAPHPPPPRDLLLAAPALHPSHSFSPHFCLLVLAPLPSWACTSHSSSSPLPAPFDRSLSSQPTDLPFPPCNLCPPLTCLPAHPPRPPHPPQLPPALAHAAVVTTCSYRGQFALSAAGHSMNKGWRCDTRLQLAPC